MPTIDSNLIVNNASNASKLNRLVIDNHLRHYEWLGQWPERFIVLGDADGAFNPVNDKSKSATISAVQRADAHVLELVLFVLPYASSTQDNEKDRYTTSMRH